MIHINDAHANPSAQVHIAEILKVLHREYPSLVIGVEGAVGPLHPEYYDLVPGYPEAGDAVVADLLEKGELSGAELFGWLHYRDTGGRRTVRIEGLEAPRLYRANYGAYLALADAREDIHRALSAIRDELDREGSRILDPELRDFLRERRRLKEGKYSLALGAGGSSDLAAYLKLLSEKVSRLLKIDLADPVEQFRFPHRARFQKIQQIAKDAEEGRARDEWKQLKERLSKNASKADLEILARVDPVLNPERPEVPGAGPAPKLRRVWVRQLHRMAVGRGLRLEAFPHFVGSLMTPVYLEEIDAEAFFEEIAKLEEALIRTLTKSYPEERFLRRIKDAELLEKLLSTGLTEREHEIYQMRRGLIHRWLARSMQKNASVGDLAVWIRTAEDFYRAAKARDRALAARLLERAGPKGRAGVAVLVTGGFHRTGIGEILGEWKIPHAVVLPVAGDPGHAASYEKVMTGKNAEAPRGLPAPAFLDTKQQKLFYRELVEVALPALEKQKRASAGDLQTRIQEILHTHPVFKTTRRADGAGTERSDAAPGFSSKIPGKVVSRKTSNLSQTLTSADPRGYRILQPAREIRMRPIRAELRSAPPQEMVIEGGVGIIAQQAAYGKMITMPKTKFRIIETPVEPSKLPLEIEIFYHNVIPEVIRFFQMKHQGADSERVVRWIRHVSAKIISDLEEAVAQGETAGLITPNFTFQDALEHPAAEKNRKYFSEIDLTGVPEEMVKDLLRFIYLKTRFYAVLVEEKTEGWGREQAESLMASLGSAMETLGELVLQVRGYGDEWDRQYFDKRESEFSEWRREIGEIASDPAQFSGQRSRIRRLIHLSLERADSMRDRCRRAAGAAKEKAAREREEFGEPSADTLQLLEDTKASLVLADRSVEHLLSVRPVVESAEAGIHEAAEDQIQKAAEVVDALLHRETAEVARLERLKKVREGWKAKKKASGKEALYLRRRLSELGGEDQPGGREIAQLYKAKQAEVHKAHRSMQNLAAIDPDRSYYQAFIQAMTDLLDLSKESGQQTKSQMTFRNISVTQFLYEHFAATMYREYLGVLGAVAGMKAMDEKVDEFMQKELDTKYDLYVFLNEAIEKIDVAIEKGMEKKIVDMREGYYAEILEGQQEDRFILLIDGEVAGPELQELWDRIGSRIEGIAFKKATHNSHGVLIAQGLPNRPVLVLLNGADEKVVEQVGRIQVGDPIVIESDERKSAVLYVHPTPERMPEVARKQALDKARAVMYGKEIRLPVTMKVRANMTPRDPIDEKNMSDGIALIRTEFMSHELLKKILGCIREAVIQDGELQASASSVSEILQLMLYEYEPILQNRVLNGKTVVFRTFDLESDKQVEILRESGKSLDRQGYWNGIREDVEKRLEAVFRDPGSSDLMPLVRHIRVDLGIPIFQGKEEAAIRTELSNLRSVSPKFIGKILNRFDKRTRDLSGLQFYRTPMGRKLLALQMASIILHTEKFGKEHPLVQILFPMVANEYDLDYLEEVHREAQEIAKEFIESGPEGRPVEAQALGSTIEYGAMIELREAVANRRAIVRHPFAQFFSFGTNDYEESIWSGHLSSLVRGEEEEGDEIEITRDDPGSENQFGQLRPDLLRGIIDWTQTEDDYNVQHPLDRPKDLCFCGALASDPAFLDFLQYLRKKFSKVSISVGVPANRVPEIRITAGILENFRSELRSTDPYYEALSDVTDDLVRGAVNGLLAPFMNFLGPWARFQGRYKEQGAMMSLRPRLLDPRNGIGTMEDLRFLKETLQVFVPQERDRLSAGREVTQADMTEMLRYLRFEIGGAPGTLVDEALAAKLEESYLFLSRAEAVFNEHYPKRRKIYPEIVLEFVGRFHAALGRDVATEISQESLSREFFRDYYHHINNVFVLVTRAVPEIVKLQYAPVYGASRRVNEDLVSRNRIGFRFSPRAGFVFDQADQLYPSPVTSAERYAASSGRIATAFQIATERHIGPSQELLMLLSKARSLMAGHHAAAQELQANGLYDLFSLEEAIYYTFWRYQHTTTFLRLMAPGYEKLSGRFPNPDDFYSADMMVNRAYQILNDILSTSRYQLYQLPKIYEEVVADASLRRILRFAIFLADFDAFDRRAYLSDIPRLSDPEREAILALVDGANEMIAMRDLLSNGAEKIAEEFLARVHRDTPENLKLLYLMVAVRKIAEIPAEIEPAMMHNGGFSITQMEKAYLAASHALSAGRLEAVAFQTAEDEVRELRFEWARAFIPDLEAQLLLVRDGTPLGVRYLNEYLGQSHASEDEKTALKALFSPENYRELIKEYLGHFRPEYVHSLSEDAVLKQLLFFAHVKIASRPAKISVAKVEGLPDSYREIIFGFKGDRPGLFASLTGVLASRDIVVESARVSAYGPMVFKRLLIRLKAGQDISGKEQRALEEDLNRLLAAESEPGTHAAILREIFAGQGHSGHFERFVDSGNSPMTEATFARDTQFEVEGMTGKAMVPTSVLNIRVTRWENFVYLATQGLFEKFGINIVGLFYGKGYLTDTLTLFINRGGEPVAESVKEEMVGYIKELLGKTGIEHDEVLGPRAEVRSIPSTSEWKTVLRNDFPGGAEVRITDFAPGVLLPLEMTGDEREGAVLALLADEPGAASVDNAELVDLLQPWLADSRFLSARPSAVAEPREEGRTAHVRLPLLRGAELDQLAEYLPAVLGAVVLTRAELRLNLTGYDAAFAAFYQARILAKAQQAGIVPAPGQFQVVGDNAERRVMASLPQTRLVGSHAVLLDEDSVGRVERRAGIARVWKYSSGRSPSRLAAHMMVVVRSLLEAQPGESYAVHDAEADAPGEFNAVLGILERARIDLLISTAA